MALGEFFSKAKERVAGLANRFFYDDTAPQENMDDMEDTRRGQGGQQPFAPQPTFQQTQQGFVPYVQQPGMYQQQGGYAQQPIYAQQPAYAPQQTYAPSQQYAPNQAAPQQQQQQPQPQQPVYSQFASQQPPQQRNRRSLQHTQENVVPFPGAFQQDAGFSQQPAAQPSFSQPQQTGASETTLNARIINVRGVNDCRIAISLLRAGDALVIVMDSVSDPAEMRRYVDTLSGACFSLSATITKVSRYGAYFIAPSCVSVFADQTTSQMNGAQRPVTPRPPYQAMAREQGYGAQGGMNQQNTYYNQQTQDGYAPQNAYARPTQDAQGFERRSPAPDVQQGAFYAQRPLNAPSTPAFEPQPAGYGYAPDRAEAVSQ